MIAGVAVKLANGEVRSLPKPARHCHLVAEYNEHARSKGWDFPWTGWPADDDMRRGEQGFVDERGSFLSRAEAARHAVECGQVKASDLRYEDTLFSEDVW